MTSTSSNGYSASGGLTSRELEEANVVEELRKVLLSLGGQGGDGSKAISPECLFLVIWKVVPQFRGHRQHDAHEFLRYMLDRLHQELQQTVFPAVKGVEKGLASGQINGCGGGGGVSSGVVGNGDLGISGNYGGSKRSSIVTNVFGGVLQSEVRCLICGMDSKKHDPFLDLSLDIPEKFYSKDAAGGGGGGAAVGGEEEKPAASIWDCLSSFTEVSGGISCGNEGFCWNIIVS